MKGYIFLIIFIFTFSCSGNKGVYWCGDHPCLNKVEKEAYFKKTMIVEVKSFNKKNIKKDSEIQKLLDQAKLDEKNRILSENELLKRGKIEEKELTKRLKLEEKKRIREEKELIKQLKLEEKKRIREEKELIKQLKYEKKTKKKAKLVEKKIKEKKTLNVESPTENLEIGSDKFEELVEKIMKKNSSKPFPEINDIPK